MIFLDSLKLELVSNAAPMKSVSHDESNTIYTKEYYAFVIDDFNKVAFMVFTFHFTNNGLN